VKIEHEMETDVSRYATLYDALRALFAVRYAEKPKIQRHRVDMVAALMYGTPRTEKASVVVDSRGEVAIETILQKALSREYEGALTYKRVCALVSLDREWGIAELYRALDERDYIPAGTSESTSYLRLMAARGIIVGTTFHLGTHIVNELFEAQKLLVHENGRVELITQYDRTAVRPNWHIVVAKKEKKPPPVSVIFGRKT
jgi:hypothetical protein